MTTSPIVNSPLLTILVPTRNRAGFLRQALQSLLKAMQKADAIKEVEIVVADNFSVDDTKKVVESFVESGCVRYESHVQPAATAEESLFHALSFAGGVYVWSFGDDDLVTEHSLQSLLPILRQRSFGYILLNLKSCLAGQQRTYLHANSPGIAYEKGADLFRDFGFISATTTISCLCFLRERFDVAAWRRLAGVSPIYSHSCAFYWSFRETPALYLQDPVVLYAQNTLEVEQQRMGNLATAPGLGTLFPFTIGLVRLLRLLAGETGVSTETLAFTEEIELNKTTWDIQHSLTGLFILRNLIQQVRLCLKKQDNAVSPDFPGEMSSFFVDWGQPEPLTIARSALALLTQVVPNPRQADYLLDALLAKVAAYESSFFKDKLQAPVPWSQADLSTSNGSPFKHCRGFPVDAEGLRWPRK